MSSPPAPKSLASNLPTFYLDNPWSADREQQNTAFLYVMEKTEQPVEWAYEMWDELVVGLRHKDNHVRAIAAQVLANLASSDSENRMLRDFEALLAVTRDERFVTARHCLLSMIRYDILQGLRRLYDEKRDQAIKEKALELIESEKDLKYRKKYQSLWRIK